MSPKCGFIKIPAHASRDDHERGGAPIGEGRRGGKRRPPARGRRSPRRAARARALRCRARASIAWTLSRPARWPAPTATNTVPGRAIRSLDPARPGGVAVGEAAAGAARGDRRRRPRRRSARASRSTSPSTRRRASAPSSLVDLVDSARASRRSCAICCASGMLSNMPDLPLDRLRARRSACRARGRRAVSIVSGPLAASMPSCWAASTVRVIDDEPGLEPVERAGRHADRGDQRAVERRILRRRSAATESVRPLRVDRIAHDHRLQRRRDPRAAIASSTSSSEASNAVLTSSLNQGRPSSRWMVPNR